MRYSIWKFPFDMTDEVKITMPTGSRILSLQVQNGRPCVWALVDTQTSDTEDRVFDIYGTGQPLKDMDKESFIGTCQLSELVFHVFEILPDEGQ